MPVRTAHAEWQGSLTGGDGTMALGSGAFEGAYSFQKRFENEPGTNPEELIGAAHAGCFSMSLSLFLEQAGHVPDSVSTDARVHLDKQNGGFAITRIELATVAKVPGIDEETFQKAAADAKENCPVSQALAVEIVLDATLAG